MTDYYAVLGLNHRSEAAEVATAYRRAALTYNPACNPDAADPAELNRKFRLVAQAYVVLSDPKVRAVYDQYGMDGVIHGGTGKAGIPGGLNLDQVNADEVFRKFFGVDNPFQVIGSASGVTSTQHQFYSVSAAEVKGAKPDPIEVTLDVTLDDIYNGATRTVTWTAPVGDDANTASARSTEFHVPKGAANGTTYVLAGKGTAIHGCHPGDVKVTINTVEHKSFRRDGNDLIVTVPITLMEALTGVSASVETLDGRTLRVLIDEVVHPKFQKRITGEGMPVLNRAAERGDLVVECSTTFPAYLTADQKVELKRILSEKV